LSGVVGGRVRKTADDQVGVVDNQVGVADRRHFVDVALVDAFVKHSVNSDSDQFSSVFSVR